MKILTTTIWYFALGSLFFLLESNFVENPPIWIDDFYYIWEAIKDILFMVSFLYLTEKDIKDIRKGRYNFLLIPSVIYFIIRFIWGVIKPLTSLAEDHPGMVLTTFTALLTGVIMFLIADLRRRGKEN